ncbi:hypothetical protein NGB36_09045 [Streptomyces sp. RB6PN25]|uniref:Uncharacterized protein n=1 Tax=Streptomyces humicola TaxID=2953240 RepID=A0ABT1PSU7_9ACTN|nr:hypothetical protein [Streptomyces humicola]MCQ4080745.1 hypothetical protein [Streptomyces humicola]
MLSGVLGEDAVDGSDRGALALVLARGDDELAPGSRHRDLAEQFQARAHVLAGDPLPVAKLKKRTSELEEASTRLKAAEAERQELTDFYAQVVNELSTELDRVTAERDELLGNVYSISLAPSRRPQD